MRIAFVGKGGSGKSTVASLFTRSLLQRGISTLAIDADINMHFGGLLGIERDDTKAIAHSENAKAIRNHLKGDNPRIESVDHFVKTTPPGTGSRFIQLSPDDAVLRDFTIPYADTLHFMHVGTYESDGIGVSCYHTSLSILENVLSHAVLKEDQAIVVDMVAGTDAFSNTLHAQFDVLALVVEPTPEGVEVYKQYNALAEEGGIADHLIVVGNKVMDDDDAQYLQEHTDGRCIGALPFVQSIRKSRQQGESIDPTTITDANDVLSRINEEAAQRSVDDIKRLQRLHELHKRYAALSYVVDACGDISGQIDPDVQISL